MDMLSLGYIVCSLVFGYICHAVSHIEAKDAQQKAVSVAKKLRVTTLLMEPYLTIKWETRNSTNNDKYEGYIKDLMDKLGESMGFEYELLPVEDGRYGYLRRDGKWDGMIGELLNKKSDIAASPMFVTLQRAKVVNFSRHFLTVGATILMKRPPADEENPIQSAEDLLNQDRIIYGTLSRGIIVKSFKSSNDSVNQRMWKMMSEFPTALTESNEDGISRVRTSSNYAFILPSTIGEYISRRMPCDIVAVDNFLFRKEFGLAFPKKSALLEKFNSALDILDRSGFLAHLYNKWWIQKSQCNDVRSSKIYSVSKDAASISSAHSSVSSHGPLVVLLLVCFLTLGLRVVS